MVRSFLERNFIVENLKDIDIQEYGYEECEIFDEDMYFDFIDSLLKDYDHYLIFVFSGNWLAQNGYKFADSKKDCFYRSYECSQRITGSNTNGKVLQLRESSHDVPMGHKTLIIGLTEKEYEKLEYADFEKIENFAIDFDNKVKNI